MHCEKMAVADMSFRQSTVTAFPLKEGNSAGVIYERLRGVYENPEIKRQSMERNHITSPKTIKLKTVPSAGKVMDLPFGIVRDA
jgi:hypothetical protein